MRQKNLALALLASAFLVMTLVFWAAAATRNSATLVMSEEFNSKLIFTDDKLLNDSLKKFSLASVTESLSRTGQKNGIDCHNRAHELGRAAYEIVGDEAFSQCGIQCHSGCLHGAMEAFFADKGTANLESNLNLLCTGELNGFFRHQCIHGVGHGLMAWTDYDLPDALASCDKLSLQNDQSSCWTGVFMENIVGALASGKESSSIGAASSAHISKYLSDDPQYPCNAVDEKYKGACYFLQTSRMVQLFNGNATKVAEECEKAGNVFLQSSCFESMGRDVSGVKGRDPEKSIATCMEIKDKAGSEHCIVGALQDQFWDESQAQNAIMFCQLLNNTDIEAKCYNQIIVRAAEVIQNDESRSSFCSKLKVQYQKSCLTAKQSATAPANIREASPSNPSKPSAQETANALVQANTTDILTIRYSGSAFKPEEETILAGQTVTFVNDGEEDFWPASNIHPTHKIYPEFDPKIPIGPGKNWSFTFTKKGTWRYHNHLNPQDTGTVVVD